MAIGVWDCAPPTMPKTTPNPKTVDLERVLEALDAAETRLAQVEQQLAHAERLATLGTLTSAVAHEFNNLLTPVLSYAQLALQSPGDPELVQKALKHACTGAQRASRVASSMLGFAADPDTPPISFLDQVVDETLEIMLGDLKKDAITFERDIPDGCWLHISPIALQQVLLNLFLNARQAIRPHRGTIRVEAASSTSAGGPAYRVCVGDTGCGMEESVCDRIFEAFQTGPSRNGRKGTGLGLSISKHLVEQHGGTIEVESKPGAGTRFTITLPAIDPETLVQAA